MTSYIGVSNSKKEIKDIYIGVGNAPKRVTRAYIGVGNVPKLVYQADWWLPTGITESQVVGHWNFKESNGGFANPSEAGSSSSYTAGTGWKVNFALNGSVGQPVCAVFRYANLESGSQQFTSANNIYMAARLGTYNYFYNGAWSSRTVNYPVFSMDFDRGNGKFKYYRGNSTAPNSGVIAFDRYYPQIYVNGSSIGCTYCEDNAESINNLPIGTGSGLYPFGGSAANFTLIAAVFYNTKLTPTQHADIYRSMSEL